MEAKNKITKIDNYKVRSTVSVFQHWNFGGNETKIPIGEYNLKNLLKFKNINKAPWFKSQCATDISSINVPNGLKVTLSYIKNKKDKRTVSLFEHYNHRGYRLNLEIGKFNYYDLRRKQNNNFRKFSSYQVPKGFCVTIYDGGNFNGKKTVFDTTKLFAHFHKHTSSNQRGNYIVKLPYGKYKLEDLRNKGILNDDISFVNLKYVKVTLFEHDNFLGRKLVIENKNANLVAKNFNDKVSSIIIEEIKKDLVINYNNSGEVGNDNLRSIVIEKPCKYENYETIEFSADGDAVLIPQFSGKYEHLNDTIYNIKVEHINKVKFYEHINYKGSISEFDVGSYGLSEKIGNYKYIVPTTIINDFDRIVKDNLSNLYLKNDSISSIKIPQGFKVTIYQHDNNLGNQNYKLVLTNNTSNLLNEYIRDNNDSIVLNNGVKQNWNDQVSFIQIEELKRVEFYKDKNKIPKELISKVLPGRYKSLQLGKLGLLDNDISTIVVPKGLTVYLFSNDNFEGEELIIKNGTKLLDGIWDNKKGSFSLSIYDDTKLKEKKEKEKGS